MESPKMWNLQDSRCGISRSRCGPPDQDGIPGSPVEYDLVLVTLARVKMCD
jgi:hypothetical protein